MSYSLGGPTLLIQIVEQLIHTDEDADHERDARERLPDSSMRSRRRPSC
jgi:hypothetical protein